MPHNNSKVLSKALHWLDKQPDNWDKYIKDSHVAIQMYLKAQAPKKKECFKKEIQKFLKPAIDKTSPSHNEIIKEEEATFLIKKENPSSALEKEDSSPPATDSFFPKKKDPFCPEKFFFLDKKSIESLKETKKHLNIEKEDEALRVLIQIGKSTLQRWLDPHK